MESGCQCWVVAPPELSLGGLPTWWISPALHSEVAELVHCVPGCILNGTCVSLENCQLGIWVSLIRSILSISFVCSNLIFD